MTAHQAAKYMVSTTAETLEINRQKLLLLIFYKQQVGFDMEQTGRGRTPIIQTSLTINNDEMSSENNTKDALSIYNSCHI